jgi:hypothetical protein
MLEVAEDSDRKSEAAEGEHECHQEGRDDLRAARATWCVSCLSEATLANAAGEQRDGVVGGGRPARRRVLMTVTQKRKH